MYKCNASLKRCPVFTASKIACKLKGDVIVRKVMNDFTASCYRNPYKVYVVCQLFTRGESI